MICAAVIKNHFPTYSYTVDRVKKTNKLCKIYPVLLSTEQILSNAILLFFDVVVVVAAAAAVVAVVFFYFTFLNIYCWLLVLVLVSTLIVSTIIVILSHW